MKTGALKVQRIETSDSTITEEVTGEPEEKVLTPKQKHRRHVIKQSTIFVIVMLAYPVAQFLLMWVGVNINSILLAFQKPVQGKLQFVGWDDLFYNFKVLFLSFGESSTQRMFAVSAGYIVVSCFVTLPIALIFSYFIFKKIMAAGFFKAIFYLPSVIPLVALTLVYSLFFNVNGPGYYLFGDNVANFFTGSSAQWMVYIFCVWAGIGYDVILITSGMARIPRDILEQCKMDGTPGIVEFVRIIIPLTWSTITTLFILGMMSMFNVYLQPYFLTSGQYGTMTIGLEIYQESGGSGLNTPATLGLFCSLIGAPVILLVRWGMNKCFKDAEF
ncbi:MAG: sugar ABC transporter permease [Coprobacillus sp.]|nr:sugar ABC transporter permease [Coprobacillus sp.]